MKGGRRERKEGKEKKDLLHRLFFSVLAADLQTGRQQEETGREKKKGGRIGPSAFSGFTFLR